jgi:DNA recombination protein RmuC
MEAITNAELIWVITGLAGLVLIGLLYGLRQYHNANLDLKNRLELSQQSEYQLRENLHAAEISVQRKQLDLEKERELAAQKIAQFEENRKQLKIEFENLANRVLEDKARAFDKNSRNSLEALLKPFREQVDGFQKRINDVHSESIKGNAMLEGEIKKVLEVGLRIGSDAQNLTDALKGDSQRRGSWGETQLEKTLQLSGLIEQHHYEKQTSFVDAEGRRKQTDFLIKLPDDKHIVIDSKVSLVAYDRAVAA